MTSEVLVTAFSLAIAAYALLSPERRLDMRIRLGVIDGVVIIVGIVAVHYLFFLPSLRRLGLVPKVDVSDWGLTRDSLAYLVLALTACYAFIRIRTARLRRRGIASFQQLAERLLHARKYPELAYLLDRHLPQLTRIQKNRYLAPRVKEALAPPPWRQMLGQPGHIRYRRVRAFLARAFPAYESTEITAGLTLQQILLSDHFVADLARSHPYLGTRILDAGVPHVRDFQTKWLGALLDDRDSILYFEIEHNQNLGDASGRYEYPTTNRLLHYYFADVRTAERLAVWKPLGDYARELLDSRFREGAALDRLNQPLGDFYEHGQRRSVECAVLSLFDYMVSEALFQNVGYHMWLYYLPVFAERIERNLQPAVGVHMDSEWPTPYHYLLYAMVSSLCEWIQQTMVLPAGQHNIQLESTSFTHENENIPKSSILALSQVTGTILESGKVGVRFQAYILDILLRLVEDLRESKLVDDYADLVIEAIARGGIRVPSPKYLETLQLLLPRCDIVRRYTLGDEVLNRSADLLGEM